MGSNLTEVIRHFHPDETSTPTFRNARSKRIEYQLDYIWVSAGLKPCLTNCQLGDPAILTNQVSDHLPVRFEIALELA